MEKPEFSGTSFHTIDSKGRLFIPEEQRRRLEQDFVLSYSSDMKTMAFYRRDTWEEKSTKLRSIPDTDRKAHALSRRIFGMTFTDQGTDSQGRCLIPQAVRKLFNLTENSEAVLVGTGTNLELWTKAAYDALLLTDTEETIDEQLDYVNDKYMSGVENT